MFTFLLSGFGFDSRFRFKYNRFPTGAHISLKRRVAHSIMYYVPVQCMEVAYTFKKMRQNYTHYDHGPINVEVLDKFVSKIDSQIDMISRN